MAKQAGSLKGGMLVKQSVMVDRGRNKMVFLQSQGGGDFSLEPLGQDCSNRLYTRIHSNKKWIAPSRTFGGRSGF